MSAEPYALGGLARVGQAIADLGSRAKNALGSAFNSAKGWLGGLGLLKQASPLQQAAEVIYPECSMTHRATGAIRLEDED